VYLLPSWDREGGGSHPLEILYVTLIEWWNKNTFNFTCSHGKWYDSGLCKNNWYTI